MLKKLASLMSLVVVVLVCAVGAVQADGLSDLLGQVSSLFNTVTGIIAVIGIVISLAIFIIRRTKSTKDDEILKWIGDKVIPVAKTVENIIPDDSPNPTVHFVDLALKELCDHYQKETGEPLDESYWDFAKRQFEEIAKANPALSKNS